LSGGLNLHQYAPNPISWIDVSGLIKCSCDNPCLDGGSFQEMDAKAKLMNGALDSQNQVVGHHIPQNAYNRTIGLERNDGPAVLMTKEDHKNTRTFSGKGNVTMRQDGKMNLNARQRMALDIKDLRKLHGNKCNAAALKAIAYAKTLPEFQKGGKS
jgi:uncharacterized protein RhaS with RHS repeats